MAWLGCDNFAKELALVDEFIKLNVRYWQAGVDLLASISQIGYEGFLDVGDWIGVFSLLRELAFELLEFLANPKEGGSRLMQAIA